MRGCLLLGLGLLVGGMIVAFAAIFLVPAPLPPAPVPAAYDVQVLVTTAYLDREVQAAVAQSSLGQSIQNVTVQTTPGAEVTVAGTASLRQGGVQLPVRIVVRPAVQGNRIVLDIVRVDLGRLPLPGLLFRSVENSINQQLAEMVGTTNYQIVGIATSAAGVLVDVKVP